MKTEALEVFEKPKSVFQQKLNDIMTDRETKALILDLIELQMYKNAEKDEKLLVLVEMYNLLGLDKFIEVMDLLAGKTIKFPEREDFKETIQTALAYYYKNCRGYSWDQIKQLLGDEELPTVKYGIKVQQLSKFMSYIGDKIATRLKKEQEKVNNG